MRTEGQEWLRKASQTKRSLKVSEKNPLWQVRKQEGKSLFKRCMGHSSGFKFMQCVLGSNHRARPKAGKLGRFDQEESVIFRFTTQIQAQ